MSNETPADLPPSPQSDEELIRAAFTDLFGEELFVRESAPCEFDPSWAVESS